MSDMLANYLNRQAIFECTDSPQSTWTEGHNDGLGGSGNHSTIDTHNLVVLVA